MKDYINKALISESNDYDAIGERFDKDNIRLLHAGMGLCTEASEILDNLKKHIFYGKDEDRNNLKEEMSDIFWYLAVMADVLGVSFEEIQEANIAKLKKRYPEGFTKYDALNRDTEAEMVSAGLTD